MLAWVTCALACSGSTEREHTATVVRGTYGAPSPIVACGAGGDGDGGGDAPAGDASGDAGPDGC